MSIRESQLVNLRAFGYTEVDARFLYLVATHSGYFTVGQFFDFAKVKSGKRNARLVEKLVALGHASAERYRRRSVVYHLSSRPIYDAIGKSVPRSRREHDLVHIKARLLALDYILAHPDDEYFETAEAKRDYFIRSGKAPENLFLPSKENGRAITFADRFPLCVSCPPPEFTPVVTFTYIDSEHKNLAGFIAHLRTYRPLFQELPSFQFLYVSTAEGQQKDATELFALFAEGNGLADLTRYFDLQTKWDNKQYGLLSEQDVLFMSEGRKRFTGDSIKTLYYLWRRNQLPKDLQVDPASTSLPIQKILFRAITLPGHEGIFGNRTKRWSDGWQIRGMSGGRSPCKSPGAARQNLERAPDT